MIGNGKVMLFANTGLNTVDVIDDIDYLKTSSALFDTFENYNISQADGLSYVTIKGITSDDAETIDCLIVVSNQRNDRLYNVLGFEMVATDTCKFTIVPEALASVLPDATVITATANRMHVNDDDTTYYTTVEPFSPSEKLIKLSIFMDPRFQSDNVPISPDSWNILETLTIPPKFVEMKDDAVGAGGSMVTAKYAGKDKEKVYVNRQSPSNPMSMEIKDSSGEVQSLSAQMILQPIFRNMVPTQYSLGRIIMADNIIVNIGARWWLEEDIKSSVTSEFMNSSVINDLRALGADNNITNYWSVPKPYVGTINHTQYNATLDTDYGGISAITSQVLNLTQEFRSGWTTIHNNKSKYGQIQTLTVFSPISGQSITKMPFEISNPDNLPSADTIQADYSIGADIRPDGAPIFTWKYANGLEQWGYPETIQGGKWRHVPVSSDTMSGSFFTQRGIEIEKQKGIFGAIGSGLYNAAKAGVGIYTGDPVMAGKGILGVGSAVGSAIMNTREQRDQQELLQAQGTVAQSELQINGSEYLREIGYNSFYAQYTYYSENDLAAFDRFLTLFGYKVNNKKFTGEDFYSRPHFNYVRLNNITWKTDNCSRQLRQLAEQELKMGVRIWHELPNKGAIESGNKE